MKDKQMHKNATYFLVLSFFIALSFCTIGCKSTPKEELPEVHPLALLDEQSSVYVSIPVQKHTQFVADILTSEMTNISKQDALKVANQLEILYAGISTVKDRKRIQIASVGSFPKIALKTILKEKNGWNKNEYTAPSNPECIAMHYPNEFTFYTRTDTDFELCFPSEKMITVSRAVSPLLDQYALRPTYVENDQNKWIAQQSEDVLFFITKPGQYLRGLIGQPIEIGCDFIKGKIVYVPNKKDASAYSGNYKLTFDVRATNGRARKILFNLLSLSLGMTDADVVITDENTVTVNELSITEKEILSLFTR